MGTAREQVRIVRAPAGVVAFRRPSPAAATASRRAPTSSPISRRPPRSSSPSSCSTRPSATSRTCPTIKAQKDPIKFLDEELIVTWQDGSEVVRVTFKSHEPADAKRIVDAVQNAFMKEVVMKDVQEKQIFRGKVEEAMHGHAEDSRAERRREAGGEGTDATAGAGTVVPAGGVPPKDRSCRSLPCRSRRRRCRSERGSAAAARTWRSRSARHAPPRPIPRSRPIPARLERGSSRSTRPSSINEMAVAHAGDGADSDSDQRRQAPARTAAGRRLDAIKNAPVSQTDARHGREGSGCHRSRSSRCKQA